MENLNTSKIEGLLKWLEVDDNQEYFEYLVSLRDSGATNMFGATPYLEEEFGLDRKEARSILATWMRSFSLCPKEQLRINDGRNEIVGPTWEERN